MKTLRALVAVVSLVTTPAFAGVMGGPFKATGTLKGIDDIMGDPESEGRRILDYEKLTKSYALTFERGKVASVHVESTGDIDCFVYDSNGKVIVSDNSPASTCDLRWKPKTKGKVTVTVWNMGHTTIEYKITTN